MSQQKESILDRIIAQRRKDVAEAKALRPIAQLEAAISSNKSQNLFTLNNFHHKLVENYRQDKLSVLAEVKRASPSKGDIAPGIDAAKQGMEYAVAGATVISCLTEPTWFKGTLEDLTGIRIKIESLGDKRPSLLRKDFLIDEYQIYEARAAGADTILLIVAAMDRDNISEQLSDLMRVSRCLGMEPLVEVNNRDELKLALDAGAKVIGVNNRNLHDFQVDLSTTTRMTEGLQLPDDGVMIALSGISNRRDVEYFRSSGVRAVLVGEALMRAADAKVKIDQLAGNLPETLVKVCGVMDVDTAIHTADAGADFIGLVFTESKRKVDTETAKKIVDAIHAKRQKVPFKFPSIFQENSPKDLQAWATALRRAVSIARPLVVGVFADNSAEFIRDICQKVPLDVVQLSGHEPFSVVDELPVTSWKALHVGKESDADGVLKGIEEGHTGLSAILLDTQDPNVRGGTGKTFDWKVARDVGERLPLFVAGGLSPKNVAAAVAQTKAFGVDVSSGVETEGKKDLKKITAFIQQAKQ
ncbi:anthranilate synthase component 2 [Planoprotostelium fungivorum]|uniref:Anthranilate synthase component 2 n=1 Tax=Planoprotostelium fungivorum TaxID=1890364 RepID=A0A2P6NRJ0_9EUKA|nr:anthranilate synthase component 2 [Planoprotostelium fungivorum]